MTFQERGFGARPVTAEQEANVRAKEYIILFQSADVKTEEGKRAKDCAREALVKIYIPMVRRLAVKWSRKTQVPFDDLFSVGNIALLNAFRTVDLKKSEDLMPYFRWTISRKMHTEIDVRRFSGIHISPEGIYAFDNLRQESEAYAHAHHGARISDDDLRSRTGMTTEMIKHFRSAPHVSSVESFHADGDTVNVLDTHLSEANADFPSPDDCAMHQEDLGKLREAMKILNDRQRCIIQRYYFEHKTDAEIGEELDGVSYQAIAISRKIILKNLRVSMKNSGKKRKG